MTVAVAAVGVCLTTGCTDLREEASVAVLQPQAVTDIAVSPEPSPVSGSVPAAESSAEGNSASEESSASEEMTSDLVTITISAAGDVTLGTHHEQDYWYSFRQAYDEAEDVSYFLPMSLISSVRMI